MYEEKRPQRPSISDQTQKEMAAFFLKTSVPRIIEKRKKAESERRCNDVNEGHSTKRG